MSRPTNIEIFIKNVDITRDDCEYEVSHRAMEVYKNKYDCYKYFSIVETGESKSRSTRYIGSHELYFDKTVRTADVLTSIKTICNSLGANIGNEVRGEDIKKAILNGFFFKENSQFPEVLKEYITAFAKVYYWSGNMMPAVSNFKGGPAGDNWVYKMEVLSEFENNGEHQDWRDWIKEQWKGNLNRFIEDNYLMDCFIKSDKIVQVKEIVKDSEGNPRQIYSLKKDNVKILEENNWELAKQLLLNHVKLIIQRSYRIENQFKEEWDAANKVQVEKVFEYIFTEAGLYDKNNEDLKTLF